MKKLLKILVGIIVVLLIAAFIVIASLNQIVKTAVNTYVPEITKTAVNLDEVDLKIFKGSFQIEDFDIHNPSGFSDNSIFSLDKVFLKVDLASLNKDVIIIDKLEIKDANFLYEIKNGKSNLSVLMNNINSYLNNFSSTAKTKASSDEKNTTSASKKIFIRELAFTDGEIKLSADILKNTNKKLEIKIPDIVVHNIGTQEDGMPTGQAIAKVLSIFVDSAVKVAVSAVSKDMIVDTVGKASETLDGAIKNIFGK